MNHNEFDDILKRKLAEMPVEKSAPDWDRMSKELEEDSIKDQIFDEQVNRKLQEIKAHHHARPSWNSLYALIDKRIQNKRRVIANKSFEMMMVCLLLFTAYNIGWISNIPVPESQNSSPQIFASVENEGIDNTIHPSKNSVQVAINNTPYNTEVSKVNSVDNIIHTIEVDQYPIITVDDSPSTDDLVSISNNGIINEQKVNQLLSAQTESKGDLKVSLLEVKNEHMLQLSFPKDFETAEIAKVDADLMEVNSAFGNWILTPNKTSKNKWFLTGSTSMQFNQIESASFKSIQNQGIRKPGSANPSSIKTAISPSMELQVGRTLGAAEISTGINFQRIQYSPDVLLTSGTLASFTETYVEEISYDFVSIPLEVNLAVYEKQNWRLRIHGGLLTSFLINAQERISQKIIRGNRTIEVEADAVDRSVFNYAFEDGFLSSDTVQSSKPSLLQTMRYKANLGLSLSKRLNRSTELFGRTDVFYQIPLTTGELNNIDLINTLSFSIGVKKYLG